MQKARKKKILAMITCLCVCLVLSINSITVSATEHVKGTPFSVEVDVSYSCSNFSYATSNMNVPIDTYTDEDSAGVTNYSYFYRFFNHEWLFTADKNVYGYKVSITANSSSLSSSQCMSFYNAVGTYGEIVKNECVYTGSPKYGNSSWYISDYREIDVYLAQVGRFYSYVYSDLNDEDISSGASVSLSADYIIWIAPYTEEDLLDEIYNEVATQSGQNEQIISKLDDIYAENVDTNTKLQAMYNLLSESLTDIEENQVEIMGTLEDIYKQIVLLNGDDVDKVIDFSQNSDNQSDKLNDMNDQLAVNKPSSESVSSTVDGNIDYDSIGVIGAVLSPFMTNDYIMKMMLATLSLCLVGYIFFGKRG